MSGRQRRVSACLAVLTAALAAAAWFGMHESVLLFAPFLLIAGLLLNGRFVGEERIVARRCSVVAQRPRAPRRLSRPAAARPLASLLARRTQLERGPPARALALAA